jgi:hypothetical protein
MFFRLLVQDTFRASARARARAGINIAAKIAMIAITTNNSIRVNSLRIIHSSLI